MLFFVRVVGIWVFWIYRYDGVMCKYDWIGVLEELVGREEEVVFV